MKINTSQISMDASAEHKDVIGRFTRMTEARGGGKPEFRLDLSDGDSLIQEKVEENHQSQELRATSLIQGSEGEKEYETTVDLAMERMVQEIVGQRIRLRKVPGLANREHVVLSEPLNPPGQQVMFSFSSHSSSYQYEKVSLHSSGSVQLEDGRDIAFALDLTMERESVVRESVAWRAAGGVLMDPLVFNFDCDLRGLVNRSFQFDLDSDGTDDESFSLPPGSGFLALDLNDDGQINDGRELFGPATGHGFAELALHDLDANGWIDENDPIFSRLRIWTPGESREKGLIGLKEAGVGAISLSHDETTFQLRDRENVLMGEVAANGFFLTETGEVRPLQEIKLAIKGEGSTSEETFVDRESSTAQIFIRQMAAIRQVETQELARLQRLRRPQKEDHDLLQILFPDWQKERGLASVVARSERNSPA